MLNLEKKHEGRFFGIPSHMADLSIPLNWDAAEWQESAGAWECWGHPPEAGDICVAPYEALRSGAKWGMIQVLAGSE